MQRIHRSARMRMVAAGGAWVALMGVVGQASAQSTADRIQRRNGSDTGEITAVTPLGVTISKSGVESTVPAEEIRSIRFAGEPTELNTARTALAAGRYRDAYGAAVAAAKTNPRRAEVLAEAQFLAAASQAALALAGQEELPEAVAAVRGFLAQHRSSYRIPAAIELYGDLLLRDGQYAAARDEYAKLAKAKNEYYAAKSHHLVGRAWQAEGDATKALTEYDQALAGAPPGQLGAPIRLAATLDRAVSQAAAGDPKQAAATIGKIISAAGDEDEQVLARAYNALGDAYQRSGDAQGALFAYLHVDLLFATSGDEHARALSQLAKLWKTAGQESRGRDAADRLAKSYPDSRWAGEK
ncbi:MAG: hypothetical protein KF688_02230 [Pirellulales bacterium]|nr:hypothetical protein [Pirellulales bacterium]